MDPTSSHISHMSAALERHLFINKTSTLVAMLFCLVVLQVSGDDGSVLDFLMDPTGSHVSHVSAVLEHDGKLFLGNLAGNYVSYVHLAGTSQELAGNADGSSGSGQRQQQRRSGVFAAAAELPTAAAAGSDADQGGCELCGLTGEMDVTEEEAAAAAEGEQQVKSCDKDAAGELLYRFANV
jgi:hypothetical protein